MGRSGTSLSGLGYIVHKFCGLIALEHLLAKTGSSMCRGMGTASLGCASSCRLALVPPARHMQLLLQAY